MLSLEKTEENFTKTYNKMEFKNKTALITGGGTGIGEAMAYQYAMKGTNVILTGRRLEVLERFRRNVSNSV